MSTTLTLFSDIVGVEVFRPGTWHGVTYLDADMDRIAENSNAMLPYFQGKLRLAPLKLGHTPDQALPQFVRDAAFGVATKYYTQIRDGIKRVYADFRNVPKVLAQAIDQFYRNRSVEKYERFRHPETGEEIRDVISSVAFLGHLPPEVKAMLDDFAVLYTAPPGSVDVQTFLFEDGQIPSSHLLSQENLMATHTNPVEPDQAVSTPDVQAEGQAQPSESSVAQSVTVNVPSTFSEDVKAAIQNAAQAAVAHAETAFTEKLSAERQAFQERLDAVEAEKSALETQHADLVKQRFQDHIAGTLEKLILPPSFADLGVQQFMSTLDTQEAQAFAEGHDAQSQYACFETMLQEVSKFWDASQQVLSEEHAPSDPEKPTTLDAAWDHALTTYMEAHPNQSKADAIRIIADQHPELLKEDD